MSNQICEMCYKNVCIQYLEDVKLPSFCEDCFKGSMYLKHYWCLKFISENAPKFLEHVYKYKYTKAGESENYFKNFGGENWIEKYHLSKPYKYYRECLNSQEYKDTLKKLIINAYVDLEQIVTNCEKDEIYVVEDYIDIYYTYEQFECILRSISD